MTANQQKHSKRQVAWISSIKQSLMRLKKRPSKYFRCGCRSVAVPQRCLGQDQEARAKRCNPRLPAATQRIPKEAVSAYFEIQHKCPRCSDVVHVFHAIPEVVTCHGISGDMDLLVFVKTPSMRRLHEIREYIDTHTEIVKIKTHVVMSEWINNQ